MAARPCSGGERAGLAGRDPGRRAGFRRLAQFMKKPGSAVLMTFSSDPHLGMTDDQFSGSAVVFPTTVTFGAVRRTASLQ